MTAFFAQSLYMSFQVIVVITTLTTLYTSMYRRPRVSSYVGAECLNPVSLSLSLSLSPWPESASELHRPSDRRLSAKLAPNFADKLCNVVSVTDPHGYILGFVDRSRYFLFQVAPRLYSRGRIDLVPDPLLLRKSGSAENRTRTSGSLARNSDH
jgi:hypothetical protein